MRNLTGSLGFRLVVASYLVVAVFMSVVGVTVYRMSKDSIKMGAMGMATRMAEDLALAPAATPEELGDRLLRLKVRRSGSTWIMDREGNLLYNPDPLFREEYIVQKKRFGNVQVVLQAASPRASGHGTPKEKLVDIAQKYDEGFGTYRQFGEERILAFRRLPGRGLLIGVDEPVESANSELKRVKEYIFWTALVSAVLIMAFSLVAIRIIIRPYYREMEDLNASLQYSNQQLVEINEKLTVSNRNLTTLYEVGLGMRHSLALRDILDLIVSSAHQALGVDRVALFLPTADARQLELRSSAGGERPQGGVLVPLSPQGGALAAAFQRKEFVRIEEGRKIPANLRLGPPASAEPFLRSRAFVAVPLVVKDRAVGVIAADNKIRLGSVGEDQANLLGIFANQAAVAVDNARLYDELRQKLLEVDARVDQLSILHQIGNSMQRDITRQEALGFILRGILEGIGFTSVAVALVDREAGELRGELGLGEVGADVGALRVPLNEEGNLLVKTVSRRGPVVIVHRTHSGLLEVIGKPLGTEDWLETMGASDPQAKSALVSVPLIAREEVVGVIAAIRTNPPLVRRAEVELLLLYANTAGLAIERAELYARMHRSLESLEVTDHVTGLLTARQGRRRTVEALSAAAAAGRPLAGILLSVDGLAAYNERCGHDLGDRSLGEIGEILRSAARPDDVVFRYGGRLFAVILPGTAGVQAVSVVEAVRERLRLHRFPGPGGARDQTLTLSAGIGAWGPDRLPTEAELFTNLLANLRQAEAGGGDRVHPRLG